MPAKRCEKKFKSAFYVISASGICSVFELWRPAFENGGDDSRMGGGFAIEFACASLMIFKTSTTPSCGGPLRVQLFRKVCFL